MKEATVPGNFRSAGSFRTDALLMWGDVPQASSFELEVADDSGFTTNATSLIDDEVLGHVHSGLTSGVTRYYRVRSKNAASTSSWSSTVTVTTSTLTAVSGVTEKLWMGNADINSDIRIIRQKDFFSTNLIGTTNLAVRADATKSGSEQVRFHYNTTNNYHDEGGAPYLMDGDSGGATPNWLPTVFPVGRNVVAAEIRQNGLASNSPMIRTFTVKP